MEDSTREENVFISTPTWTLGAEPGDTLYSAPTPGRTPEAQTDGEDTSNALLAPLTPGARSPHPIDTQNSPIQALDSTYSSVPLLPFPFDSLPLIARILVFEWYLLSLGTRGSSGRCDCFGTSRGGWFARPLSSSELCYNLHKEFGYHAKFLPLLLTSRAMYADFRPLRYALGEFRIVAPNCVRNGRWKEWGHNRFPNWPDETEGNGDAHVSYITPFPENALNRGRKEVKAPLMLFQEVPLKLWDEIRVLDITMEFEYWGDWRAVRKELEGLASMLRKREKALKRLEVTMGWGRAEHYIRLGGEDDEKGIWRKMVEPLGEVDWVGQGAPARSVLFRGRDWWEGDADVDAGEDENGEQRTFCRTTWEEFSRGLDGALGDGELEVEYWHCGS